jgi:hypothetical protein
MQSMGNAQSIEPAWLLRSMAEAPYPAVRLDVVQAMARDRWPESRQLLETMTMDTDSQVRNEAIRLLEGIQ